MITGACNAAIQERIKFNNINGNGSKLFDCRKKIFNRIHMVINIPNEIIKVQLPPKEATLSAKRYPKVIESPIVFSSILSEMVLLSMRVSTTFFSSSVSSPISF